MVFFTCNACGASVKKNQVEKHWQSECPNCEVLSCIDCGKDFYGDEYASHTKCISEAEKYQGALYKETGGNSKGERKQQEWLERVRSSVSASKVSPKLARLLEKIAEYPNIPRKKTKFENFVRNSCCVWDQTTLEQLWIAFSAANEKKSETIADVSESTQEEVTGSLDEGSEKNREERKTKHREGEDACTREDINVTKSNKKKKRKSGVSAQEGVGGTSSEELKVKSKDVSLSPEESGAADSKSMSERKKKKKGTDSLTREVSEVTEWTSGDKQEAEHVDSVATLEADDTTQSKEMSGDASDKKIKKKKRKHVAVDAVVGCPEGMTDEVTPSKKRKCVENGEDIPAVPCDPEMLDSLRRKKAKKRKKGSKECADEVSIEEKHSLISENKHKLTNDDSLETGEHKVLKLNGQASEESHRSKKAKHKRKH